MTVLHPTLAAVPRALALLALALTFAACGAGPATSDDGVVSLATPTPVPTGSAAPAASVDPEVAMAAFTKCMKEHGVDVFVSSAGLGDGGGGTVGSGPATTQHTANGDPQAGSTELDPKAMQEADEACRSLLPSGMLGDPSATMDPAVADQMLAFAKCMRDHGIDFPDPKFEGGGVSISLGENGPGAIDPSSDEFTSAEEACGSELPGGGPGFVSVPATPVKP
jgi:hypothetical protein